MSWRAVAKAAEKATARAVLQEQAVRLVADFAACACEMEVPHEVYVLRLQAAAIAQGFDALTSGIEGAAEMQETALQAAAAEYRRAVSGVLTALSLFNPAASEAERRTLGINKASKRLVIAEAALVPLLGEQADPEVSA